MSTSAKSSFAFRESWFMSIWLLALLLVTNLLFLCKISISPINFVMAFVVAVCLYLYVYKDVKSTVVAGIVAVIIMIICIWIGGLWVDYSWDGSTYHKFAVGALKEGYNPIYMKLQSFADIMQYPILKDKVIVWSEAYPKASWYIGANIYSLTGNVESGKAYTLLFMVILFGVVYQYAINQGIHKIFSVLVGLMAVLNPICLAQFISYYLDGMATCVMIALLLILFTIRDAKISLDNEWLWSLLAMIAFGCNLKFSVTFFVAITCMFYYIYVVIRQYKDDRKHVIRLFVYFVVSVFVAFVLIGGTTYLTNFIRYQNPFYGFIGSGSITDGVDWSVAFGISGYNNAQMFLASLFGRMGNISYDTMTGLLKPPFTYAQEEIQWYGIADPRTGGFGVLYSGIFIVSVCILLAYACIKIRKKEMRWDILLLLSVNFAAMLILPGTFQVRYVGHLYIVSVLALIILLEQKGWITKALCAVVAVGMLINVGYYISPSINSYRESTKAYDGFQGVKYYAGDAVVNVSLVMDEFIGCNFNLRDYDIKYVYNPDADVEWRSIDGTWIRFWF